MYTFMNIWDDLKSINGLKWMLESTNLRLFRFKKLSKQSLSLSKYLLIDLLDVWKRCIWFCSASSAKQEKN